MGIVVKQSIKTSLITYLGALIGYFNVLWLYPYFLSTEEIGMFRVIQDTAILLVPFAQMGLASSMLKFFPNFNHSKQKSIAFLNTLVITGIMSALVFIGLLYLFRVPLQNIFAEKAGAILPYLKLILVLIVILTTSGILETYSRSLLKIVFPNFVKEVLIRVFSSIIVSLYFLRYINLDGLLISLVGIYALALIIMLAYLAYLGQLSFSLNFNIYNKKTARKITQYSLFSVLSASSGVIVKNIDSLMVTAFLGLTTTAVYTTAFFIATVIEMPKRALHQITTPLISTHFKNNNLAEVNNIYKKSSLNMLIIGLLILIGIWANIDNLYFLIPKWKTFAPGKIVVLLIGVSKLIDMSMGNNGEMIMMSKYYKFNIVAISALAVGVILGNYFLIPMYGMMGAALASLLAMSIYNVTKLIFIKIKYNMQPLNINTIKVLAVGFIVYYLSTYLPKMDIIFLDILVRSVAITLIYGMLILKLKVSSDINTIFNQILKGDFYRRK